MEASASPGAPASGGLDSAAGRLVGALVTPRRTFAAIAARPTFLVPLVLWTALTFLVSELVLSRTDWRATIAEGAAHREQKLTDAQLDQMVESSKKFSWIFEVIAAVVPAAIALITAGALWMGCQAFGWELRFRQSLGVVAHAFLPGIFSAVVLFALLWGKTTIDPQGLDEVLRTNPSFLVSRQSDKVLHSLLASFDVLSFWTMALIVLGLSAATGASKGRVAALVLTLWGLYVLGKAGLGIAFS
ncbi:MAG TPA: YIP1 family protein [Thermoanaerobaculia bacterium]|nr:YIP1 family protein [Thermoanaerobaculia bacterium]